MRAGGLLGLALLCAPGAAEPAGGAWAATAAPDGQEAVDDGRSEAWRGLAAEDPELRRRSWDALLAAGAAAAREAFAGWDGAGERERRLRARLVERFGGADLLPEALPRLADPDPGVRARLARFLGRAALGAVAGAERLELLARLLADDPAAEVRRAALQGLRGAGLAGAGGVLAELLPRLPPDERAAAAAVLVELPGAREPVLDLVQRAARGAAALDPAALAVLVEGYGRLLAERPGGGARPEELGPLLALRRHFDPLLRRAALQGVDGLVTRLDELGEDERTDQVLARFAALGWSPREMHYRRAYLALRRGALSQARRSAGELLGTSALGTDSEEWTWRFYGLHLTAVVDFAEERFDAAAAGFAAAQELMRAVLREREDLRPDLHERRALFSESHPRGPVAGAVAVDRIELVALGELWRALALLARHGAGGGDGEEAPRAALEALRSAHVALLESQAFGFHYDVEQGAATWDALLDRDLGPRALLLAGRRLPGWGGARALDLALLLGRALATVSPDEVPGFAPLDTGDPGDARDPRLSDPFADEERFALLRRIEEEEVASAQRDLHSHLRRPREGDDPTVSDEPSYEELRLATLRKRLRDRDRREGGLRSGRPQAGVTPEQLGEGGRAAPFVDATTSAYRRELYRELSSYRGPSVFALNLSWDLREEGRNDEAEALARAMLAALARGLPGVSTIWTEWTSARLEMSVASSRMDANRPEDAERELLNAVGRLEDLQRSLEERLRDSRAGGDGQARAYLRASIEQTRSMLSSAFLSLAVNANVRMGQPERALGYFERAYGLDDTDFMRVLLACYRARSGHAEEARAVLRTVEPAPQLYYNLACTHALLGETDVALDYLQRELTENHPTPGSLARQKEWARGDPDLRSLRGLPRFERLVAP